VKEERRSEEVRAQKVLDFRFLFAYDSAASILPSAKETTIMTIGQSMLSEFDQEMGGTRKTIERLPDSSGIGSLTISPGP